MAGIVLISDIIRAQLNADCSVLMGANVANDMASDAFCETTIGYKVRAHAPLHSVGCTSRDDSAGSHGVAAPRDPAGTKLPIDGSARSVCTWPF